MGSKKNVEVPSTAPASAPTSGKSERRRRSGRVVTTLVLVSGAAGCNFDPVHDDAVQSLGEEASDVYPPESEYHRPGQPCTLCHSSSGPASSEFVLGGTVFWGPTDASRRVANAYVRILDANRVTRCFVTNCNGNFFVRHEQFARLTFPLLVGIERTVDPGRDETTLVLRRMTGHIGREGSCASCHILGIRDFGSPGQVGFYATEEQSKEANPPLVSCPPPPDAPIITACPEDRL